MQGLALFVTFVVLGCASAACPNRWYASKDGHKCYFRTPYVKVGSLWEQQTFCSGIGGQVVEPKNMEEWNEVKNIIEGEVGTWSDAPFINYLTLTNDAVVSATTLKEIHDDELFKTLSGNYRQTNGGFTKDRCLNFLSDGFYGFDDCLNVANPFCEMPMKY